MKKRNKHIIVFVGLLSALLVGLFWKPITNPDYAVFSNDGPLGIINSDAANPMNAYLMTWQDLNHVGMAGQSSPTITNGLLALLFNPQVIVLLTATALMLWFSFKTMRVRLMVANGTLMVACFGLLTACLAGWIDPYLSRWMLIYPVAFFLLPWLLLATFVQRFEGDRQ